jgi:methyltransferase (TIGR00027 family)
VRDAHPSRTAIRAAVLRAAHQLLDDDPKILVDPVAVELVRGLLPADGGELQSAPLKRLRAALVLRNRYAEDLLAEASRRGMRQYVILGAGLDTFAYRQPPWAHTLAVFEADHPATQTWKREALQLAGIPVPGNVRFCPVDLEIGSLPRALAATSFHSGTLTFVSWLGGTQYLSEAAINSTLGLVRSLPPGSEIVFSVVVPDTWLDQDQRQEFEALADAAASGGEPWITRLDPTVLRSRLLHMGFSRVYHLTPELATERYLSARRDGLMAPRAAHLMRAVV